MCIRDRFQVHPVNEFHADEIKPPSLPEVVGLHDVGVDVYKRQAPNGDGMGGDGERRFLKNFVLGPGVVFGIRTGVGLGILFGGAIGGRVCVERRDERDEQQQAEEAVGKQFNHHRKSFTKPENLQLMSRGLPPDCSPSLSKTRLPDAPATIASSRGEGM